MAAGTRIQSQILGCLLLTPFHMNVDLALQEHAAYAPQGHKRTSPERQGSLVVRHMDSSQPAWLQSLASVTY